MHEYHHYAKEHQELKAEQGAFPVNALRTLGYEAVWQRGSAPGTVWPFSRETTFPC
jgi:exonuclease III